MLGIEELAKDPLTAIRSRGSFCLIDGAAKTWKVAGSVASHKTAQEKGKKEMLGVENRGKKKCLGWRRAGG